MESNKTLDKGFIQSLIFPFHLGVSAYNLILSVVIALLFGASFYDNSSNISVLNPEFSQTSSYQIENQAEIESQLDTELNKFIEENPQLTDDDIAQLEANREKLVRQLSQQMGKYSSRHNTSASVSTDITIRLPSFLAIITFIFILYIAFLRNTNLFAQIMTGNFSKPSFSLTSYVSFFFVAKWYAAYWLVTAILGGILFFLNGLSFGHYLGHSFTLGALIIFIYFIVTFLVYSIVPFAILYTLSKTDDVLESINPKNWIINISSYLGWFNFSMFYLFVLIIFIFTISILLGLARSATGNATLYHIYLVIGIFLFLQGLSACFYFLGYISQMNDSEGFEGIGSEAIKEVKREVPTDPKNNTLLAEVKSVYQSGYIDDAMELARRGINNADTPPQHKLELKQFLVKLYQEEGNQSAASELEDQIMDEILTQHPDKIGQIYPSLAKKIKSKELDIATDFYPKLADIAYQQGDIELVKLLTQKFANKQPNDEQLANLYFFVAKGVLEKENNAEQAYKVLFSLVKKYPNHPQILDFKSMLALTKKRVIRERQQNTKAE